MRNEKAALMEYVFLNANITNAATVCGPWKPMNCTAKVDTYAIVASAAAVIARLPSAGLANAISTSVQPQASGDRIGIAGV